MAATPRTNLIRMWGFSLSGDVGDLTVSIIRGNRLQAYAKAPPKEPASAAQQLFRQWLKAAAQAWRAMTPKQRAWWKATANKSGAVLTGPSLWIWYTRRRNDEQLATLARQAGAQFPPP